MSSTRITIANFNGTHYITCVTTSIRLVRLEQVNSIIEGYYKKPNSQGANRTVIMKTTIHVWMNNHGVA